MEPNNILIRPAVPEDAEQLLAIYAPYVERTAITFEYETPSLQAFADRIRHTLETYPYLTAERDGKLLGYAYAGVFKARPAYDWAVETSLYVHWDHRREGLGRMLHDALESALQKQGILNMNACIAYPRGEDPFLTKDSVYFHEKLGYRLIGTFTQCGYKSGRWYDMVWMEKLIGEHLDRQPAVIPFRELK